MSMNGDELEQKGATDDMTCWYADYWQLELQKETSKGLTNYDDHH